MVDIVRDMAEQREATAAAGEKPMTVAEALAYAEWLQCTPDPITSAGEMKKAIAALHACIQGSRCFYKGAKLGIPTATFIATDMAAPYTLRTWAQEAQDHGAPPEKYQWAIKLANEWDKLPNRKWPD